MPFSFRFSGAAPDTLLIGLGNPGEKYARTRHNVGFDVIDIISARTSISASKLRCHALTGVGVWRGVRVAIAKPNTYMNDSGRAVAELLAAFRPRQFAVIYDDIDLPQGQLRVRASGSAGTHNGMRSIIDSIGRSDFPRVRVGIGKPPAEWDLKDWVLSRYSTADERQLAFDAYNRAADAALELAERGVEAALRIGNAPAAAPAANPPRG
ncbi:MAG: aminoacyl-tRNA hydrolase [Oscillospiraceae bacterium]|jgi:PTH1 family peptidyl-tRNA hydrolase|nr:aminoacyl-tRNA hydrolase [Oscillospiraceae bacterium]